MKNYFKIFIALMGSLIFLSTASAQDFSEDGAQIFTDYCEACHQPGGVGFEDVYPALKGNTFVQGDKEEVIYLLLEGRAGMPTFIGDLEPEQITTIINYIRNSWGNKAEEVTQDEVDNAIEMVSEEDDGFGPGN
ncbi:MAG: cytochrome c [Alphaproteobacteria bacterium]|nr:cytochrome c [Alphaproteobacteria bacterium]HPF46133.1 cytochrome c [Emcibacteraceae bacterium]HRW29139.1 cytochrome c [Emcibacteraceae bacterium]